MSKDSAGRQGSLRSANCRPEQFKQSFFILYFRVHEVVEVLTPYSYIFIWGLLSCFCLAVIFSFTSSILDVVEVLTPYSYIFIWGRQSCFCPGGYLLFYKQHLAVILFFTRGILDIWRLVFTLCLT